MAEFSAKWAAEKFKLPVLCEPKCNPISFYVQDEGFFSTEVKGEAGWFTDKVFVQNGQTKTIAELLFKNRLLFPLLVIIYFCDLFSFLNNLLFVIQ